MALIDTTSEQYVSLEQRIAELEARLAAQAATEAQLRAEIADLRRPQAALEQEQRLHMFETLVENAAIGMALTDLEGRYTYANALLRDTYGYGDAMIGTLIPQSLTKAEQVNFGMNIARLFADGRMKIETEFVCADGSVRPAMVDALLIRDADGAPLSTAAIIRDLTAERERERELRLTRFSLDRLPDSIQWFDHTSRIVDVNASAWKSLGYTREELIGMTVADIDPVFPVQNWEGVWQHVKDQGMLVLESAHRRKDGTVFPIDLVAGFLEFEGREYVCVIARDISERKQAENRLRQVEVMVENAPDGFSYTALDGSLVYMNPAFRAMLGLDETLVGAPLSQFFAEREHARIAPLMQTVLTQGRWQGVLGYRRADGSEFDGLLTAFVVRDHTGAPIALAGIARDLTEQQRAEAERLGLQQQVIAAQQEALRELSTPLIPIADGVVVMPLIGTIDAARAQMVVDTLLNGVSGLRAHTTIIDITGVPVVDTQVANAMLRAAQSVKLLGARVFLTGIRPEVAQTLVGLGVDLSGIITRGTLQSGIAEALGHGSNTALNGRR